MKLTRLIWPILLSLLVIIAGSVALSLFQPTPPAYSAPTLQQSTSTPFWRFLDTVGDGTGTKKATGTYTSTQFYLQPPAGAVFDVSRLVVSVEDAAVITNSLYGGVTITNGVVIRRVSGSTVITLTDGITIANNLSWRRYCAVTQTTGQAINQLQAVCDFAVPVRLSGDKSERLEVLLQDDFSGLDGHYFVAEGYRE